jgi:hypothetical protein
MSECLARNGYILNESTERLEPLGQAHERREKIRRMARAGTSVRSILDYVSQAAFALPGTGRTWTETLIEESL